MKNIKLQKGIKIATTVVFALLFIVILSFLLYSLSSKNNGGVPQIFGKSFVTVKSNSMNCDYDKTDDFKGFKKGDIIVIKQYTRSELIEKRFNVNDIITFKSTDPLDNKKSAFWTHRIIEINEEGGYYVTQGDVARNLEITLGEEQAKENVLFTSVIGVYESKIPWFGNIFLFLENVWGFLICIVLPLLIIFVFEVVNFVGVYKEYKNEKKGIVPGQQKTAEQLAAELEELKKQLAEKQKAEENQVENKTTEEDSVEDKKE